MHFILPADERLVAARAVGRTPEEHAALELALSRRRARRHHAQQVDRQVGSAAAAGSEATSGRSGSGSSRVGKKVAGKKVAVCQQPSEEEKRRATEFFLEACRISEQERLRSLREDPSPDRDSGDGFDRDDDDDDDDDDNRHYFDNDRHNSHHYDPFASPQPQYKEEPNDEANNPTAQSPTPTPTLASTRALIRTHPSLSQLHKSILLLATQIPRGTWTTSEALRAHLLNLTAPSLSELETVLALNPLGDAVPCHRVIRRLGGDGVEPASCCWRGRANAHALSLLRDEGVRYDFEGRLRGVAFQGFDRGDGTGF
ncbi:hypothetical protein GGR54DRAFT_163590 [Hypoxylon sp. NC1633]|nr:hypothetical protein GGR54DRAFT_163590 [Hypoxylon sp. NC1633]